MTADVLDLDTAVAADLHGKRQCVIERVAIVMVSKYSRAIFAFAL